MSKNTLPFGRMAVGAAALICATVAAVPAISQDTPPEDMLELRLAVADADLNPVTDSALKLAEMLGYYEMHGVRVEIVRLEGTPQAVAALNSGAVDLADISVDAALRLRGANDVALSGVVSATLGPPYLIAARDEFATVADLVGQSYAIADNGSLDHNLTQHVLASMGIDRNGPEWVTIGPPGVRAQALAADRVDATTISYGSFLPIAETEGLHILVQPEDFFAAAPVQSKFVVALDSTIAEKGEAIQRFVDALIHIARDFDQNPEMWIEAMAAERDDLSVEDLEATTAFLSGRWCINGCINVGYIQETVDFIYGTPDFENVPVVTAEDVTDDTFVSAALAELGAYEGGGIDAR